MQIRFCAKATFAAGSGLLLIAGCSAPGSGSVSPPTSSAAPIPVALDEGIETQWDYLRSRYDADGDGQVSAVEYSREGQSLERWDRNDDGLLSDADFESSSREGGGSRSGMMRGMRDPMARRMLSRYFQEDEDHSKVSRAEYDAKIASYDANADGVVDADEFRARSESSKVEVPGDDSPMVQRFMGSMDPWDTITAAVDKDESGGLSTAEFASFYVKMAEGEDQWDLPDMGGGGSGRGNAAPRPKSGPALGTVAPDFTLESPTDEVSVSLSSFAGEKPVALIFGSYT